MLQTSSAYLEIGVSTFETRTEWEMILLVLLIVSLISLQLPISAISILSIRDRLSQTQNSEYYFFLSESA